MKRQPALLSGAALSGLTFSVAPFSHRPRTRRSKSLCTTYQFQKNLSNQINRCGPTVHCMDTMFNCPEVEDVVLNRKRKFLIKYASLDNLICFVCQNFANPETAAVSVVWPA